MFVNDLFGADPLDENLKKWFKEKWVRFGPDGKIRGACARDDDSEGKPKCLPQAKAHALGKKGRASAGARKRREDPNPERSGKAINVATKKKSNEGMAEAQLDEKCWDTHRQAGMKKKGDRMVPNCVPKESVDKAQQCPECGGPMFSDLMLAEKKDACYNKVRSRYKVWPSAYASGALVQCRKKGAANWGNKSKNEARDWDEGNREPANNFAITIDGRQWKVFPGMGYYADDEREMKQYYKLKDWCRKKSEQTGKQWEVFRTGAPATESVAEGGPFSYGKPPRKGSVADLAAKKRKEQDRKTPAIEPKDQQVGVARVVKDVAEGLNEFAPPGSGDNGNDGFNEETLKMLAAQWYNGDEDPRVEQTLAAAGWEIGQDEGYDDEPGVFVVQAGDVNGNSYISWPAHELKQGVAEGDSGAKYKIKSIGRDKNGDYYISPSTGKKVYKSGVKRGDHENPKTGEHKGVAEGSLEANTPNPIVVIQDLKGNILDKVNLSVAVQKYKLGNSQDIKNQLAHQNYTTIGNYVVVAPMTGQPQDNTTQGVAEGDSDYDLDVRLMEMRLAGYQV